MRRDIGAISWNGLDDGIGKGGRADSARRVDSIDPEDGTAKALGLGASDFVSKPFRVKELVARVETQLKRGRELRSAREDARARGAIVDILHELTDSLKPD